MPLDNLDIIVPHEYYQASARARAPQYSWGTMTGQSEHSNTVIDQSEHSITLTDQSERSIMQTDQSERSTHEGTLTARGSSG